MRIVKHSIKHFLWFMAALILAFGSVLAWLSFSTSGLKLLFKTLSAQLPGTHLVVKYDGVSGNLLHPQISKLVVKTPQFEFNAQGFDLHWAFLPLLHKTLSINLIAAKKLSLHFRQPQHRTERKKAHLKQKSTIASGVRNTLPSDVEKSKQKHRKDKSSSWHIRITQIDLPQVDLHWPHGKLSGKIIWQQHRVKQDWAIALNAHDMDLSYFDPTMTKLVSLHLKSVAQQRQQQTTLLLSQGRSSLKFRAQGHQEHNTQWINQITQLDLVTPLDSWSLEHPGELTFDPSGLNLKSLCLHHKDNRVCLSGQYVHDDTIFKLNSNTLNLKDFGLKTGYVRLDGDGRISMSIQHDHGIWVGFFKTDWQNLKLLPQDQSTVFVNGRSEHYLDIKHAALNVHLTKNQLKSKLDLEINPHSTLSGKLNISQLDQMNLAMTQGVDGALNVNMPSLALFDALMPNITDLKGKLHSRVHVHGSLKQLSLSGHLILSSGSFFVPSLGVTMRKVDFSLKPQQNQLVLSGHLQAGNGSLALGGHVSPSWIKPDLSLRIQGQNFLAVDLPSVHGIISPNLTLQMNKTETALTGEARLPELKVNGDVNFGERDNPDIVYINDHNQIIKQQTKSTPLRLNVLLKLGKDAHFKGFGIDTHVIGQARLIKSPNGQVMANGRLNAVNGQYRIYGKHFKIKKGSYLSFANSPIVNPALNLTAIYQLSTVPTADTSFNSLELGVRVGGTISNLKLTLFSKPSLSQQDILSYMVLGQPLSQANNTDTAALGQAALLLAERGGGSSLLHKLKGLFGIDQISVGSLQSSNVPTATSTNSVTSDSAEGGSSQNSTALFVGKNIGKRFKLGYGVGLFNQQQEVTAQWILNRYFTLQANTSDSQSGADIIYTINR